MEPKQKEFRFILSDPIEAHGAMIEEIVIPLPFRVAHLEAIDDINGNNKRMMKLIEVTAKIPPSSIKQITWQDFAQLAEGLQPFLSGSPKTTETSSGT